MSTPWYLLAGTLLVGFVLAASFLRRLPATAAMLYLAVGALLGPWAANWIRVDAVADSALVETLTEIAVIVSLFTAGLKLRLPRSDARWRNAVLLATVAMALTIGGITTVGIGALGLPLGAAVLLGAVLAPTDPVLASDVQVTHERDVHPVRFTLTGEAGLNDGMAFPFVMLGLGLVGAHELGAGGWRWIAVDLVWAVAAGLAIGTLSGAGIARLVLYLRRTRRETEGLDEFLALGLIALSYGAALAVHAYGFLAVFAAGLSVRRIERKDDASGAARGDEAADETSGDGVASPAHMARAVLGFNERLERLGELAVVIVVGAMLARVQAVGPGLALAGLLFCIVRPLATTVTLVGSCLSARERLRVAWFGVRGIGSIYYLSYALEHGLAGSSGPVLADVTLVVVAASIVLHGISVTPIMKTDATANRSPS